MAAISKLTQKYQATIPKEVRQALGLQKGDAVLFEIGDADVVLKRVTPLDAEYLKALEPTLSEWLSDYDEEAFGAL